MDVGGGRGGGDTLTRCAGGYAQRSGENGLGVGVGREMAESNGGRKGKKAGRVWHGGGRLYRGRRSGRGLSRDRMRVGVDCFPGRNDVSAARACAVVCQGEASTNEKLPRFALTNT